jgi:hypothetical protein
VSPRDASPTTHRIPTFQTPRSQSFRSPTIVAAARAQMKDPNTSSRQPNPPLPSPIPSPTIAPLPFQAPPLPPPSQQRFLSASCKTTSRSRIQLRSKEQTQQLAQSATTLQSEPPFLGGDVGALSTAELELLLQEIGEWRQRALVLEEKIRMYLSVTKQKENKS